MSPVLDNVLSHLENVRRSGDGWQARCPAHDDRNPSLSIREGENGRVLLKCFAGCATKHIVEAMGITMADLFEHDEVGRSGRREIVATYDYTDEEGNLLFQSVRCENPERPDEPKTFRQRRPDRERGWIWDLNDTRRVLYRLPEVQRAIASGEIVFVVEGEKDVETLRGLGLVATCNPMGAGKWRIEYSLSLQDARVVVIPDNDDTGRDHALSVARDLLSTAEVRMVELPGLPVKGDVSDWVAVGGDRQKLLALVEAAPSIDGPESPVLLDCVHSVHEDGDSDSTLEQGWEEPLPFDAPIHLPPFPTDALPEELAVFIGEVARVYQVPEDMPGMLALAQLSAAGASGFRVRVGDTHEEPLNLFVAVVAEPGTRKSQVYREVSSPLGERERRLVEDALPHRQRAEEKRRIEEDRLSLLRKKAARSSDPSERDMLIEEACKLAEKLPPVPSPPRLITDDVTPEKLCGLLAANNGRIALMSAEGGVFDMMAGRYYERGGPNLDVYLKGYSGDNIAVDRQQRESVFVSGPALTIGLTVQPQVLLDLRGKHAFRGRGLLGRFLFCFPEDLVGTRKYQNEGIPNSARDPYGRVVQAVADKRDKAEQTADGYLGLAITGSALEAWRVHADAIEERQARGQDLYPLRDWASKLAGQVARIAGDIHLAIYTREKEVPLCIDQDTVEAAWEIGHYLVAHAQHAFAILSETDGTAVARCILKCIVRSDWEEFSFRDLHQHVRRDKNDLECGLAILEERGYVRQTQDSANRPGPGRKPSPRYCVNPRVHDAHITQKSGHRVPISPVMSSVQPECGEARGFDGSRTAQVDDDVSEGEGEGSTEARPTTPGENDPATWLPERCLKHGCPWRSADGRWRCSTCHPPVDREGVEWFSPC